MQRCSSLRPARGRITKVLMRVPFMESKLDIHYKTFVFTPSFDFFYLHTRFYVLMFCALFSLTFHVHVSYVCPAYVSYCIYWRKITDILLFLCGNKCNKYFYCFVRECFSLHSRSLCMWTTSKPLTVRQDFICAFLSACCFENKGQIRKSSWETVV